MKLEKTSRAGVTGLVLR